eukprot:TRINITY_DN19167_c0_g1_i1.p1 TRINITY_DN19167_c0_g1~~TRINITY_DN19167_c0_g1_i1.p1  ORF type:complete len:306 (-),score=45.32 TRINITY_DN19167_c0_g1_i1:479-1357(-)
MDGPLGNTYRFRSKIGAGSFGSVFIGIHAKTGLEFAVKIEALGSKRSHVLHEAKLYKVLGGGFGIPQVHWYGSEGPYNILVLDLLGPSLDSLFSLCNRRFGLKTVLMLADQMLSCMEYIHSKNVVHRDVKPGNFTIGNGQEAHQLYLIDFGLAKFSRHPSKEPPSVKTHKHLKGNVCYRSVNGDCGNEVGRRDDLESVGYVLIHFLQGSLPWHGLKNEGRSNVRKVMAIKMSTNLQDLCKRCDPEFTEYLEYCRSLDFDEWPDYAYLQRLFWNLFFERKYKCDFAYDWMLVR